MNILHALKTVTATVAILGGGVFAASAQTYTTVTWNRQAFGQAHYVPGHENDPLYAFNYPNNNDWHQSLKFYLDAQGNPLYETAPSNWSTSDYPNGTAYDVILGNGSTGGPASTTNLDRYGDPISIHSLTILPEGALNIEAGTTLTAMVYDFRGDGTLTQSGGGGAFPILTLLSGGTMTKSGGPGTYTLQGNLVLNAQPGATIACNSGVLQLPGNTGLLDGTTFFPAGGVIDLVGMDPDTHANTARVQGTLTSGSLTGTVRLSANSLNGNRDYSSNAPQTPAVLNFPGSVFQWTGGQLGAFQGQNPFTNTGTITISGSNGKELDAFLTNNATITQSGAGVLLVNGNITNSAGAVYELRDDAAMDGYGPVVNAGLLTKTSGAGQSMLNLHTFVNTGTFAVHVGKLVLPSIYFPTNTLTTGIWQVYASAELDFRADSAISINQADVTLSGPNSNFPAFNAITDNQGSFALLAQREFTSAGALSNEGTITLDAGSTLHVPGPYTGGSASTLAFVVGGTQSQGAQSPGVLQSNGAVTLGGTLSITLGANVALPGPGDTVAILSSSTAINGSFANAANGARLTTTDGRGSFQVNYGPSSTKGTTLVVLSNFVAQGAVAHPAFFGGEVPLAEGVYYLSFANGQIFGYYRFLSDPRFVYHYDLGFEYVFDAADGNGGVYFYDFTSSTFFYTSPTFSFPYLYDFNLKAFLYYYPDPTNPQRYNTGGKRYFYNFSTGQVFSK